MLRFTNKPDSVFTNIVTNSLELAIENLENDIIDKEIHYADDYFEESLIKSYGDGIQALELIMNELKKLLKAHHSEKIYMPTDHHFKLLYRVLEYYCDTYKDFVAMELEDGNTSSSLFLRDKNDTIIKELDLENIVDFFFWDTDFLLSPETAAVLTQHSFAEVRTCLRLSDDAVSASLNMHVDASDLRLKEWTGEDMEDADYEWIPTDDEEYWE